MLVLGLTGGSGSGKGYVSRLLANYGIPALDCDLVSRQICTKGSECLAEIVEALGESVLTEQGDYNRREVAEIVFSDSEKLQMLNRITHRYILSECRRWLWEQEQHGMTYAIIDAPVLYESGFDAECDRVIAVICKREERIQRICARDGISAETAELRISKQKSDDFYRVHADYIITNNADTTKNELIEQIEGILRDLNTKGGESK